jgi:hypothetical protein
MSAVLLLSGDGAVRYFNVTVVSVGKAARKLLFIMVDIELAGHGDTCTVNIEEAGVLYKNWDMNSPIMN